MKPSLTRKQSQVVNEIRNHMSKTEMSPTVQELSKSLGYKSFRTVTQYLDILERKGYLTRRMHTPRNIKLTDMIEGMSQTLSIPVVASVGCDDLSVFANEQYDEYLEVDKEIVDDTKGIVAVRAIGDSMVDAGIHSGDYILVQFTDDFRDGDRVAAIVNDMVVVKRLERRDGLVILRPESKDPKYKPIVLNKNFKLTGKVLCVIPSQTADMTEVVPL